MVRLNDGSYMATSHLGDCMATAHDYHPVIAKLKADWNVVMVRVFGLGELSYRLRWR